MKYDMSDLTEEQKNMYIARKMDDIQKNYETFSVQREERKQSRLEHQRKIKIRNKAAAIIIAVAILAGSFAVTANDFAPGSRIDGLMSTYDEYVQDVERQREQGFEVTISEDGFQAFCQELEQKKSKGSK